MLSAQVQAMQTQIAGLQLQVQVMMKSIREDRGPNQIVAELHAVAQDVKFKAPPAPQESSISSLLAKASAAALAKVTSKLDEENKPARIESKAPVSTKPFSYAKAAAASTVSSSTPSAASS